MPEIHCERFHGGVGVTMAAVLQRYWIPKLRSLLKSVSKCHGSFPPPIPVPLPEDRSTVATAFEVIGIDFAGPIRYKERKKREEKAYLAVFTCSLSRAAPLELLPNLVTDKYIQCLKRLIAQRGRPQVIYSGNGGTFVKTSKWLHKLRKDEHRKGLLDEYQIKWKFNLSRAPWWSGQFESLIAVIKMAM